MAELISARADVSRIEDHVRRALRAAQARGGEIAEAAAARLVPAVATIDEALVLQKSTDDAEAVAWSQVLAEDAKSDEAIGSVRDAMWNAIGRTRQNAALDQVFPGGVRRAAVVGRPEARVGGRSRSRANVVCRGRGSAPPHRSRGASGRQWLSRGRAHGTGAPPCL